MKLMEIYEHKISFFFFLLYVRSHDCLSLSVSNGIKGRERSIIRLYKISLTRVSVVLLNKYAKSKCNYLNYKIYKT
jgi:hypothetical protein